MQLVGRTGDGQGGQQRLDESGLAAAGGAEDDERVRREVDGQQALLGPIRVVDEADVDIQGQRFFPVEGRPQVLVAGVVEPGIDDRVDDNRAVVPGRPVGVEVARVQRIGERQVLRQRIGPWLGLDRHRVALGAHGGGPDDPVQHRARRLTRPEPQRFGDLQRRIEGRIGGRARIRQGLVVQPDHIPQDDRSLIGVGGARPGHLNGLQQVAADLEVAPTGLVGQEGGVGATEQLAGVVRRLDPQAGAQLHVGAHLIRDHAGRTLGGQNQRHAKGPAQARDAFELRPILRIGHDHLGELVDDDEQVRERLGEGIIRPEARRDLAAVFDEVSGAAARQQRRPLLHDGLDGHEHALHRTGLHIGQDVHHVRQLAERLKGGAALEIDQHEVEDARVIADGHSGNERHQQLRLAGPGRAGDHAVHPVFFRREDQVAGLTAADEPDRNAQPFLMLRHQAARPVLLQRDLVDRRDATPFDEGHHLQQFHRRRKIGARRTDQLQAPEPGGELLSRLDRLQQIGDSQVAGRVQPDLDVAEDHLFADGGDFNHRLAVARDLRRLVDEEEDRRAQCGTVTIERGDDVLGSHVLQGCVRGSLPEQVHNDQQEREGDLRRSLPIVLVLRLIQPNLPLIQLDFDSLPEAADVGGFGRKAELVRWPGLPAVVVVPEPTHDAVRQPLGPFPAAARAGMTDDVQAGVLRGVEGAEVRQHGAGEVGRLRGALAEDPQRMARRRVEAGEHLLHLRVPLGPVLLFVGFFPADRPQRDRDGDVGEDFRVRRQTLRILQQRRLVNQFLRPLDLVHHGGLAAPDPQSHNPEIGVAWTSLPDAGAKATGLLACRDLDQGGDVRIVVVEEHALGVVRSQHLLPHLGQPHLVGVLLLGGGLPFRPQADHAEDDGGSHGQAHEDHHRLVARTRGEGEAENGDQRNDERDKRLQAGACASRAAWGS